MSDIDRSHVWAENAAPFALGVLDDDERHVFEGHLSDCVSCQAEVTAYREVVAQLAFAAPDREPPPSLRQRVLDVARSVRPIGTARGAAPSTSGRPRASVQSWLAVASAGAALIALSAYLSERSVRTGLEQSIAGLTDAVSDRETELARLERAMARRDSVLAAVLAPEVETTRLAAAGRPPSARLYWNRQQARVVMAAFDLEPAPAGRTYQLWGIANRTPISLGTFNTSSDGRATVVWAVDPSLVFELAAVTEEPAGGSAQPTTAPFLSGPLTR
jgi:anti-sigma-K factor RskA